MKIITRTLIKNRKKFLLFKKPLLSFYRIKCFKFKVSFIFHKNKINSVLKHIIKRKIKNYIIHNFELFNTLYIIELRIALTKEIKYTYKELIQELINQLKCTYYN